MYYLESGAVAWKWSAAARVCRRYRWLLRLAQAMLCSLAMAVGVMPVRADAAVFGNEEYEIKALQMRPFTFFQRQQEVIFIIRKLTDTNYQFRKYLKVCDGEQYVVGYKGKVSADRLLVSVSVFPKNGNAPVRGDAVPDGYASGFYLPINKDDEIEVRVPVRLTGELATSAGHKLSLGIDDVHPLDVNCRFGSNPPTIQATLNYQTLSDQDATPVIVPLDWQEQRIASNSTFIARVRILGALQADIVKWKGSDGSDVSMSIGDPIRDPVDQSNIGHVYTATLTMPVSLEYHASVELLRNNKIKSKRQVVSSINDVTNDAIGNRPVLFVNDCSSRQRCTLTWRSTVPYRVTSSLGVSLSAFQENAKFAKSLPEKIFSLDYRSAWQNHQDFAASDANLLPAINRVYYQGSDDSLLTRDTVMPHSGDFTLMFEPVGSP
ncbi:hypothetical protein E9536_40240 [Burkholderia sp. LS-044]|uniref:hypothetical protein n=1 Tax=Burkholderia sp. LS-044 TaxID=1459967 RepID=UPI0010A63B60|nr:hypothetical protein [Burkholderia sp. LS-044]THJ46021.1 hypothetical protein E9536_40240 [Burkholderia sp. LS-044]